MLVNTRSLLMKCIPLPVMYGAAARPARLFHNSPQVYRLFSQAKDTDTNTSKEQVDVESQIPKPEMTKLIEEQQVLLAKQQALLQEQEKQLKERENKLQELTDGYRRSIADMENLRQRTQREIQESSQFSIQKFAKDLLNIADVLEVAISSVPQEELKPEAVHLTNLLKGVDLTHKELLSVFKRHGLVSSDPLGANFDPNVHNALFQVPSAEKPEGTIMVVQKKGYILNGRVIRAANVGVAKKPE